MSLAAPEGASGIMMGHYEMVNEAGMPFHAKVPHFR